MGASMRQTVALGTLLISTAIINLPGRVGAQPVTQPVGATSEQYIARFSPRVRGLLRELTLDEKLSLNSGAKEPVYGGQAAYSVGVPRLGIPSMRWADGASGINSAYDATALPSSLSLASTFDPALARQAGELLGAEARSMKIDVVLAPYVNLARLPNSSGAFGEDPFLAGVMAASMVKGIQSTGAMTMTQQYLANVQFFHQGGGATAAEGYNFIIDDRTLHEIYLPPFEAAIRAGTTSIMAAYNQVNGDYNAENRRHLTGILRDELGFAGWANSDWHANRSTISITRGLDVEMPGSGPMDPEGYPPQFQGKLKSAIQSGQIPMADLDRAVGRLLGSMERFGFLDHTRKPAPSAIDVAADAAVSRRIATEGAVLLKNDGILPLKPAALQSLLLIGPTAVQIPGAGGNRAYGFPDRLIPAMDALKASAPGARISFSSGGLLTGVAVPESVLYPAEVGGQGLARDNLDGSPLVAETVDYTGDRGLPAGHAYQWKGTIKVAKAGVYTLEIASWGGSATLKIDGKLVGSSAKLAFAHGVPRRWSSVTPSLDNMDHALVTMNLDPSRAHTVEIDAQAEQYNRMHVRFGWITPEMRQDAVAAAVQAARTADTAIVFVWNGRGGDQNVAELSAKLPNNQDELVEAVASVNRNTIVVMNTGTGVDLPWRDKVRAILQMWVSGQEGSWAASDILLGKVSPSGRLPMSWPRRIEDTAPMAAGHPERYDGLPDKKQVIFSEGLLVGYRWFDAQRIEPLFPFGHGLTYTQFAYSGIASKPVRDGADVSFTVRNEGRIAAYEIAQVYVGPPAHATLVSPPQSLSGIARIGLAPGESRRVTVHVPARQFAYWSSDRQRWITQGGVRPVRVGSSSRDIRLTGSVRIKPDDSAPSLQMRPGEIGAREIVTGRIGAPAVSN